MHAEVVPNVVTIEDEIQPTNFRKPALRDPRNVKQPPNKQHYETEVVVVERVVMAVLRHLGGNDNVAHNQPQNTVCPEQHKPLRNGQRRKHDNIKYNDSVCPK